MKLAATLSDLSPRLQEVAILVSRGLSYKEIAHAVDRAESTIRTQVYLIYRQLKVQNRVALANLVRDAETPRDRIFLAFQELTKMERETVIADLVEIHQRKEDL